MCCTGSWGMGCAGQAATSPCSPPCPRGPNTSSPDPCCPPSYLPPPPCQGCCESCLPPLSSFFTSEKVPVSFVSRVDLPTLGKPEGQNTKTHTHTAAAAVLHEVPVATHLRHCCQAPHLPPLRVGRSAQPRGWGKVGGQRPFLSALAEPQVIAQPFL